MSLFFLNGCLIKRQDVPSLALFHCMIQVMYKNFLINKWDIIFYSFNYNVETEIKIINE